MKKQIISIVLAVSMLATMLTAFMLPAVAADEDPVRKVKVTAEDVKVDGVMEEVYLQSTAVESIYKIKDTANTKLAFKAYMVATYEGIYIWTEIMGESTYVNTGDTNIHDYGKDNRDYLQLYYNMSAEDKTNHIGYIMHDYRNSTYFRDQSGLTYSAPEGFASAAVKTDTGWISEMYLPWRPGSDTYAAMQNKDTSCSFRLGFQYNDDYDGVGGKDGKGQYDCAVYDKATTSYWSDYTLMPKVTFITDVDVLSKTNVFVDGDMAVDYNVTLHGKHDPSNVYVEFTVTGADGKDETIKAYGTLVDPSTNTYNYSLCLAPHRMGDTIKPKLIIDGAVRDTVDAFTIKDYCLSLYNQTEEESKLTPNQYAAMKLLVVDMLHYGAIAQLVTKYDTDNLVNKGVEVENWDKIGDKEYLEELEMRPISFKDIEVSKSNKHGTEFTATNVYFDSSNRMYFKFKTNCIDNVMVSIGDGTPGVPAKVLAPTYIEEEDAYIVYTDIIDPADYDKEFTVRLVYLTDKGTDYENSEVIQTVKCSLNSYFGTAINVYKADMLKNQDAYLAVLLSEAAYNYGHSMVLFAGA